MKIAGYTVHPLAEVFPMLEGDELDALVADVREQGLREPITIFEGKILDGRNRARAATIARIPIKTRNYKGNDPASYVVSLNMARRHLSESQRAMVASKLATAKSGRPRKNASKEAVSQTDAAKLLNTSRSEVQRAGKVRKAGVPELVSAVEAGKITVAAAEKLAKRPKKEQLAAVKAVSKGEKPPKVIRELNRKDREKKLGEVRKNAKPLTTGATYGVIYADPPWQYDEGTTDPSRKIENQYPTMTLEEICALPVNKLAKADAVLYLWVTAPMYYEAHEVLRAWGFKYKSQWIWEKEGKRGTGYWTIVEHEIVIIATKGNPPPPETKRRWPSVFKAPVGKHSEKPEVARSRVENSYPDATRIELFYRGEPREGWAVWGNEAQEKEKAS